MKIHQDLRKWWSRNNSANE